MQSLFGTFYVYRFARKDRLSGYDSFSALAAKPPIFSHVYAYLWLFSILVHHQTTTAGRSTTWLSGCLVSYFITKPQQEPGFCSSGFCCLVSYFITKPQQHAKKKGEETQLFSILFHHQTTTFSTLRTEKRKLFSILFHHQTTTPRRARRSVCCCLVSYFITKPQPHSA